MVRFAVVGFGFMGGTHAAQIKSHPDAQLAAVVEKDAEKLKKTTKGNIDTGGDTDLLQGVETFSTLQDCREKTDLDAVSICLPTHMHRPFAVDSLQAGLDVICEKPFALNLEDCDAMINAADKNNRLLFVAQCIRFWPEYEVLKEYVDNNTLGKPLSFLFRRVGTPPVWSGADSWFIDPKKSGGAVFDLHVHDLDFIHHLLGRPGSVFSRGLTAENGLNTAVLTQYVYDGAPICIAEGSWSYPAGFKMAFTAVFEKGKLEYDSSMKTTLTLTRQGVPEAEPVSAPEGDGYSREYDYFIQCIKSRSEPERIMPSSARRSIEIALAEVASMRENKIIDL